MLMLSSQNGSQTVQLSGRLSEWITGVIYGDSADYVKFCAVHLFIRKAAHIFLFAVQAVLFAEIISCFKNAKLWFCAAVSACASSLFALADEWHKMYIPGRHFDIFDVMLNIVGAVVGAAGFFVIHYFYRRRKNA